MPCTTGSSQMSIAYTRIYVYAQLRVAIQPEVTTILPNLGLSSSYPRVKVRGIYDE